MTEPRLRRDQSGWLLLSTTLTLAPHAEHLPLALGALCALLLLWRGVLAHTGRALPHRLLLLALAAGIVAIVQIEFKHLFGKDPGIALLAGLLSLKLLETDSVRDGRAVVLLSFFMQLGQFLYQQNMAIAALALLGSMAAIASLLALQGSAAAPRLRAGAATRLVLQGVPLMLVLFVLFPRVQGPLWGLPADAYSSVTGLSNSMAPGDMARLSESSEIAFRAAFEGDLPPPTERYWRGPVLSRFDGHTWRPGRTHATDAPAYRSQGIAHSYTLTLEPHNQSWLLALDFPGSVPGLIYTDNFQLLSREPVRSRQRLTLVSYPHTPVGLDESPNILRQALDLPAGFNPRTRELGARLHAEANGADDIVTRAIAHFRNSRLRYTLDPAPLGRDDVDSFLFDTQQGFCEHFSAAFVVTLRAAGVPARVVTGYQGGEFNPVDGTLVIRQSDAHAWTEVWLAGQGWVRIDPTAASAPLRIQNGLAAAMPDSAHLPLLARTDLAWLRDLRNRLDALDNSWNQWVLGYNPARQKALLAALGFAEPDWQVLTALMGAASAIVMGLLTIWALRRRSSADAIDRSWTRFCRRLKTIGCERATWEGPLDFAERLARQRPDLADAVRRIASDYARLRYGPADADPALGQRFHQSIKNFRPR